MNDGKSWASGNLPGSADELSVYVEQLRDPYGPNRRRAAVALGKSYDQRVVQPLLEALKSENEGFVRASVILALGAIGGDEAIRALDGHTARGPEEAEALTKALDRIQSSPQSLLWLPSTRLQGVRLEVPEGLERPASRLLLKENFPDATIEQSGLIRLSDSVPAERLAPPPRWVYGLRLLIAERKRITSATDGDILDSLLAEAVGNPYWKQSCQWAEGVAVRYRFAVEGRKISRDEQQSWLRKVRQALDPLGAIDSPSQYSFEVILSWTEDAVRLYFRPSMVKDPRFAYRLADVNASINPIVAANLARLIPWPLPGAIIDPTCGSGTLLFERGIISPLSPLIGIDVSEPAVGVARMNADAGGFASRADLRHANARDPAAWSPCGVVIANLPFGILSGREDKDLEGTYRAILDNANNNLNESGRVVLATANRGGLERATAATRSLQVLAKYRFQSGGVYVHVAVLGRGGASKRTKRSRH